MFKIEPGYAIIITGGEAPSITELLPFIPHASLIVAADSGYNQYPELHTKINHVIGDFDSLEKHTLETMLTPRTQFSSYKDYSDTELALRYVLGYNPSSVLLVGGGGGRLDHLLDNLQLFQRYTEIPLYLFTKYEKSFILDRKTTLKGVKNAIMSFYSLTESSLLKTKGLEWELTNRELNSSSMSLSNKCVLQTVELSPISGRVLVILVNVPKEQETS